MESVAYTDPNTKVREYSNDQAPAIKKYTNFIDAGYGFVRVDNKEEDSTYKEETTYKEFDGLKLMEPYHGNSYTLEVGPN